MTTRFTSLIVCLLLASCAARQPVAPIVLPGSAAGVHGTMLRYEPQPNKNTLGYWVNVDDYATWEVAVERGGVYDVEVLQGCGTGQGGSEVAVSVAGQTLRFTVLDTGHFQNFVPRIVGRVKLSQGTHTLAVRPVTKAKDAVMDLRQVTLLRVR